MQLKELFSTIDPKRFTSEFSTEKQCLEFLANEKWDKEFVCKKCGHTNYCKGKTPFSRRCTRCKSDESATAHTPFHGCKIPITVAFQMTYQICHQPDISSYKLAEKHDIRQMTCWKLKKKISECLTQNPD